MASAALEAMQCLLPLPQAATRPESTRWHRPVQCSPEPRSGIVLSGLLNPAFARLKAGVADDGKQRLLICLNKTCKRQGSSQVREREGERQTDRQTDRQTERERERERERGTEESLPASLLSSPAARSHSLGRTWQQPLSSLRSRAQAAKVWLLSCQADAWLTTGR